MYWALERMAQEMRGPQSGSELIVQQLAFMLVIQALRLHADDSTTPRTGWLFALRDKKLRAAIACMHDAPGQGWTVETLATQVGMSRSAFAQHFSQTVGMAPAACLTQWRMLLACDRLQQTDDSVLHIATSLV